MDERRLNGSSDVCIIGGSIAGGFFTRLLQQNNPSLRLCLIDAGNRATDGKTIIIDKNAADCLTQLGALPPASSPIHTVHVSVGGINKTIGDGKTPLGYSIAPQDTWQALASDINTIQQAHISHINQHDDGITLSTDSGDTHHTRLLVVACPLSILPPSFTRRRLPYRQTILSLRATCDIPPATARQKFIFRRVLVLVPRAGSDDSGVIICAPAADAGSINALSDSDLSKYLSQAFNLRVNVSGKRYAYSPQLVRTTPLVQAPIVLMGSGATVLHPIGAQAISLAMRDAQQLAALFSRYSGSDLPPAQALHSYQQRRQPAHATKGLLTSALALGAL